MPPEQQNEQEIQFKKRARRRLVGAVALVLLMITILPMLLDDRSAKTTAPEIEINMPNQDDVVGSKAFTSKVIAAPVKEQEQEAAPVEAKPVEQPTQSNQAEVNVEKAPAVKEEKKAVTQAVNPEAEKAIVKKAEPKKEEVLAKPVEPNVAEKSSADFMVQIGVFSNEENVKQLQQKLKDKGFSSNTEKIQTTKGEKLRLRVGPFVDRGKAEQALAVIKGAGMTGMVVSH